MAQLRRHSVLAPLGSIRAAIASCEPDFILPCDDDAAMQLCALYAKAGRARWSEDSIRDRIGQSLGVPDAYARMARRGELAVLAAQLGVRTPATGSIETPGDLQCWLEQYGFPAVLKLDTTWGGQGVTIVDSGVEARRVFAILRARPPILRSLARMLLDRDLRYTLRALSRRRPSITVQQFIDGTPANRAVACWNGRVLAGTSVEALCTHHATGPATVVRLIDNPEMAATAARLVQHLGISGLWGLDFVVERATGAAYLIEVNPRATPTCHLAFGTSPSLPLALYRKITPRPPHAVPTAIDSAVVAMFPGEWQRDPFSAYLKSAYHDVPWREPKLVRDGTDRPWAERGIAARWWAERRRTSLPARGVLDVAPGAGAVPAPAASGVRAVSGHEPRSRIAASAADRST